jgi:hypothetical protein
VNAVAADGQRQNDRIGTRGSRIYTFVTRRAHMFKACGRRRREYFNIEPFFRKALRGIEHTLIPADGQKFSDIHHRLSSFASSQYMNRRSAMS